MKRVLNPGERKTSYAIRWIGKRNDAGTRRWKEEERTTKQKMDG